MSNAPWNLLRLCFWVLLYVQLCVINVVEWVCVMDMNMYVVAFVHAVPQVVHITPHGGVAPPSQSGQQQQQQTPQQSTSSGHQTPTPSQHAPYAVQQVGPGVSVMPSAAGTPPQTHLYHAMTQHPVMTPQGPAPPSPQVVRHSLLPYWRPTYKISYDKLRENLG